MFPTHPGGPCTGHPIPAKACCCVNPALHRGACLTCGRLPDFVIRRAWAVQARREARGQRNVVVLDEYRTRRLREAA